MYPLRPLRHGISPSYFLYQSITITSPSSTAPLPLPLLIFPFTFPIPFAFTLPPPPPPSPPTNAPIDKHPGQLCKTSCANTSQSTQKCLLHFPQAYLELTLFELNVPDAGVIAADALVALVSGTEGKGDWQPKQCVDLAALQ